MFERILGPNANDMFRILFSVRNRNRVHNAIVYSYDIKALTGETILNNWQPHSRFRHSYFNRNYFQMYSLRHKHSTGQKRIMRVQHGGTVCFA